MTQNENYYESAKRIANNMRAKGIHGYELLRELRSYSGPLGDAMSQLADELQAKWTKRERVIFWVFMAALGVVVIASLLYQPHSHAAQMPTPALSPANSAPMTADDWAAAGKAFGAWSDTHAFWVIAILGTFVVGVMTLANKLFELAGLTLSALYRLAYGAFWTLRIKYEQRNKVTA